MWVATSCLFMNQDVASVPGRARVLSMKESTWLDVQGSSIGHPNGGIVGNHSWKGFQSVGCIRQSLCFIFFPDADAATEDQALGVGVLTDTEWIHSIRQGW